MLGGEGGDGGVGGSGAGGVDGGIGGIGGIGGASFQAFEPRNGLAAGPGERGHEEAGAHQSSNRGGLVVEQSRFFWCSLNAAHRAGGHAPFSGAPATTTCM